MELHADRLGVARGLCPRGKALHLLDVPVAQDRVAARPVHRAAAVPALVAMEAALYGSLGGDEARRQALLRRLQRLSMASRTVSESWRVYQTSHGTRSSSMARVCWGADDPVPAVSLVASADGAQANPASISTLHGARVGEGDPEAFLLALGHRYGGGVRGC